MVDDDRRLAVLTVSGLLAVVASASAAVTLAVGALAVGEAAVTMQRAAAAADAAALAAADARSGAAAGTPCTLAADLAVAHDTHLAACSVDDLVVTVTVTTTVFGLQASATARAGPALG